MIKYILFFSIILFINCTFIYNEDTSDKIQKKNIADTLDTVSSQLNFTAFDSLKLLKLKEYSSRWNATCFPMPAPVLLKRKPETDPGYLYLINNFDSLSEKISTEKERSAGDPCSWKQKFKSGIVYTRSTCAESGATYSIHTNCPDKRALVALVDIIFQADINNWNNDSTKYEPILQEAGNYYSIEKNTEGNYDISYSSSY